MSAGAYLRSGPGEYGRLLRLHLCPTLLAPRPPRSGEGMPAQALFVTLTTTPTRVARILPAVNSLLDQTAPPERIFLALPRFSRREQTGYVVPEELRGHPSVTILTADRDWGPATKLLPALRHLAPDPDACILAVDDDNVYPRTFLETFRRHAAALPEAALGLRGCAAPPSRRWRDCREFAGTQVTSPTRTDVLQGCGGILVRPRFFDAALWNYEGAPPEAFFSDDLWISGHLARRRISRYVVPHGGAHIYLPALATFAGPALDRDENRSGRNNDVMLRHFDADWG